MLTAMSGRCFFETKVFGEKLRGFDLAGDLVVVAVCEKNKKKTRVTLDSIQLVERRKYQEMWIKAYLGMYPTITNRVHTQICFSVATYPRFCT